MAQVEEIYQELRREIINGDLASDTPLREIGLARRFEVSRTPIREVLHRLANEKLIRIIPNIGSFVGAFTWEDASEVFEIRQVLESYAAGLTAARISDKDIAEMETLYSKMEECKKSNDGDAYAVLDEAFHEMINKLSGNKLLLEMIHSVNDRAKLSCLRRNLYAKGEIQISLADHREIIDIFKEHDSAKASEKLMIHGRRIFNKSPENQVSLFFKKRNSK